MPLCLGLGDDLEKGDFPFRLINLCNEGKVFDGHPPISYYDVGSKKPGERKAFEKWYDENRHRPFNYNLELERYCRQDVEVLTKCLVKFRRVFMNMTRVAGKADYGVDPFHNTITIASACSKVYR